MCVCVRVTGGWTCGFAMLAGSPPYFTPLTLLVVNSLETESHQVAQGALTFISISARSWICFLAQASEEVGLQACVAKPGSCLTFILCLIKSQMKCCQPQWLWIKAWNQFPWRVVFSFAAFLRLFIIGFSSGIVFNSVQFCVSADSVFHSFLPLYMISFVLSVEMLVRSFSYLTFTHQQWIPGVCL